MTNKPAINDQCNRKFNASIKKALIESLPEAEQEKAKNELFLMDVARNAGMDEVAAFLSSEPYCLTVSLSFQAITLDTANEIPALLYTASGSVASDRKAYLAVIDEGHVETPYMIREDGVPLFSRHVFPSIERTKGTIEDFVVTCGPIVAADQIALYPHTSPAELVQKRDFFSNPRNA